MCSHCLIVQTIPVENNEENLISRFFFFFGELPNTSVMKCIESMKALICMNQWQPYLFHLGKIDKVRDKLAV